ncbi:hypothetical protein ACIBCH_09770 [Amycolatopsis thailandensis]|uniref:hypothetical protein n=1 Tax=Amycolatopsis thailandensis TaxID=589330 RepID=UPI0037A0BE06
MTPLWEFDHPYYCSESNYFSNGYHTEYGSWEEFVDCEGDNDFDMNLVFRWDWKSNEFLEVDTVEARREYAARFGDRDHAWTLSVFWMGQRKGIFRCTDVKVCKANEPAVREWLTLRAEHMRLLWEPLLADPARSVLGEGR